MYVAIAFFGGLLIGALFALYMVARDKKIVQLNDDMILVKRSELETVIKGYAMAVKKIDPDLASEL